MDHAQENTGLPVIDFSSYNSASMTRSPAMSMLSPTTLPAEVVAEVFPISRPSRRSTSTAVGSASDGSGRWYYNCPEFSMEFCESPVSPFCTGHDCRTKNLLYLQQPHLGDKADVVRFLYWFPFLYTHLNTNISH
jgi:hypothetical protein